MCSRELLRRTLSLRNFFFVTQTSSKKSSDHGENFWLRSTNCFFRDQRIFFGKFFRGSLSFFYPFRTFYKNNSEDLSRPHSMSAEDRFERKRIFSKKFFPNFSDLDQTILGLWQYLFNQVADFPLEGPGGVFWEQFFWKKNLLFQILSQKCSENGKIFRLHSVYCILRDQKNIFRKFFLRFEDLFCQFRTFRTNNSERLLKLLSRSPEDRFGKKIFFRKRRFFPRLLDLQPTFSRFWATKSRVVRQNYNFTFSKKPFFEEKHFLEKLIDFLCKFGPWTKTFLFFQKKLRHSCQTWISAAQRKFLRRTRRYRGKLFFLFQTLSIKLSDAGKILLTAFSQLHITYPIHRKIFRTFFEFGWPILTLWDFLKKNFGCLLETVIYGAQRKIFFQKN